MSTVEQNASGLEYGQILEFLKIDFTSLGGSIFNIYSSFDTGDANGELTFLDQQWTPLPFKSDGWMFDGTGGGNKPTITISDANALLLTALFAFDDAIGIPVYRYESTVDSYDEDSYYGPEVWLINRIVQADGMVLKFELAAPFEQFQKKVPNKQMFRSEYPGLNRA